MKNNSILITDFVLSLTVEKYCPKMSNIWNVLSVSLYIVKFACKDLIKAETVMKLWKMQLTKLSKYSKLSKSILI